ncbi:hypothetical protein EV361DRAFT_874078, partial [Lentinula raphanica]
MSKRRNSKSEKASVSEGHEPKRKKDKDTRDTSNQVTEDPSASKASSVKISTSRASNSKSSNATTSRTSGTKATTSKASSAKTSSAKASTSKSSGSKSSGSGKSSGSKSSSSRASTAKASSSKASQKEAKKTRSDTGASVARSSFAPISSFQHGKQPSKHISKDSQLSYMPTLHEIAPPKEEPRKANNLLTREERNVDLGDEPIELYDSEEEAKKAKTGSDIEDEEMGSNNSESSHSDMDIGFDDNMSVKDVTPPEKPKKKKKKKGSSKKSGKVVEGDFEDVELARLGKSSVRMAICIEDMWPREDEPSVSLLTEELGKNGNDHCLLSLQEMSSDPEQLQILHIFMNYGTSQVRSDIGKVVRILVAQFYELSVTRKEEGRDEAERVKWLLKDNRYHQIVNLKFCRLTISSKQDRTVKGGPFSTPLIGKILRVYFVDSPSYLDVFLIKHMKRIRTIPDRLVVMIASLIEHAIREWTGGSRMKIHLTRKNAEDRSKARAKTHTEDLMTDLYGEMMSHE